MEEQKRKMPHLMAKVYEEIEAHPRFKDFSVGARFGYGAARTGLSWRTKENNAWIRRIWKCLYWEEPMPEGDELFPPA